MRNGCPSGDLQNRGLQVRVLPPLLAKTLYNAGSFSHLGLVARGLRLAQFEPNWSRIGACEPFSSSYGLVEPGLKARRSKRMDWSLKIGAATLNGGWSAQR